MPKSNPQPQRATRADVARLAGVSPAAVTTVLSGKTYGNVIIGQATRQRIRDAARQLNYKPNVTARSLTQGRSMLVAYLCRQIYRRSHEIMLGMQDVFDTTEYSVVHYSRGETLADERKHLQLCWDRGVDGLILTPMFSPDETRSNMRQVLEMVNRNVPVIQSTIDAYPEVPSVTLNIAEAARLAADHLIQLGHRRIALLTSTGYRKQRAARHFAHPRSIVNAYKQRLADAGLKPTIIHYQPGLDLWRNIDQLTQEEEQLTQRVLDHPDRPTAVITPSDYPAIALIRAMTKRNLPVPERLSIVGMHNERAGRLMLPSLTSVELHHQQLGSTSARLLLKQIEGESVNSEQVQPELIVRESTAPPAS